MIAKRIIIFLITFFFISLYIIFLFFFQIPEMYKAQDIEANIILKSISFDIKAKDINLFNLPNNFFFALWIKNQNKNWIPIIYDGKLLSENHLYNPDTIPQSISIITRVFNNKIGDYEFKIWLNKMNAKFIVKYIFLSFLFLILIFLIIILLIEIFFRENPILVSDDEYLSDKKFSDYDTIKKDEHFIKDNKIHDYYNRDIINIEENLSEYKKLWSKNFNITDDFKNNFPFKKIYDLVKIGIKPEKYISDSIEIASSYFKWENPVFYLNQKNYFIDINSKSILKEENIKIPVNGNQKGKIFIPLFPYKIDKIYGYLYFEWNNKNNFYISDFLFFLKYLFSERAKYIFLNTNMIEKITSYISDKFEDKADLYSAIIEVDNKDKLILESKADYIEKLDDSIKENLSKSFINEKIFQLNQLNYILIGKYDDKNEKIKEIETWIKDIENQYYTISSESGSIAITYSGGITFKNNRDLHPVTLLNESENNLKSAIQKGGNIVVVN